MLWIAGVEANMRALKWFGLLSLSVVVGCGGESSKDNDDMEPEGGSGNETGGVTSSGSGGAGEEAGEGSGGTTGGKSTGKGGGTSPGTGGGSQAGAPPTMGGSPPVPPMGGAGGVPKPPPPTGGSPSTPPAEGCMPVGQSSSTSYCQLGLSCENTEIKSSCSDQGGGTWWCECSSGGFYQQYVVRDPLGMPACETVANLCASGKVPDFTGPEECLPALTSRAVDNCQLQEQCSRPLDVDGATVSAPTTSRSVFCFSDGLGGLTCSCNNGSQYQLQGVNGLTACDLMGDICADPAISFDEEPVCTPSGTSTGIGYCSTSTQCTQSEEIADGVFAVRQSYRNAECQALGTGGSRCTCYTESASMQFDSELSSPDLGTCNLASELCLEKDSLELSGPVTCSQASQIAEASYCNSSLDCTQSGTLGGQDVKLHGYLSMNCSPSGDSWACTCSSGSQTATMSVEREGTAWDDCTRASDQCLELIDVEIGGSNGGVRPPPFPPMPGVPAF
jgi:hypothetical protein